MSSTFRYGPAHDSENQTEDCMAFVRYTNSTPAVVCSTCARPAPCSSDGTQVWTLTDSGAVASPSAERSRDVPVVEYP